MASADLENPAEVESLYPQGSAPENRIRQASALCSFGTRPHAMTGLLRQLLMQHFCDASNIEDRFVRKQLEDAGAWRPSENGENRTGLLIESITKWKPNDADHRPGLLIKRGAWRWNRRAIGDSQGEEYRDGFMRYSGFWQGSHVIFALSREEGAAAEFLATEVSRLLLHYAPLIVEQMNLHRFVPVSVDALHEIREVTKGYAVPVTVAYAAEESWTLEPYAPRLKRIQLKASEMLC